MDAVWHFAVSHTLGAAARVLDHKGALAPTAALALHAAALLRKGITEVSNIVVDRL